jgi:hypothetical protein
MIDCRPYTEPEFIKLAYSFEQVTDYRVPPVTTPPLGTKLAHH